MSERRASNHNGRTDSRGVHVGIAGHRSVRAQSRRGAWQADETGDHLLDKG